MLEKRGGLPLTEYSSQAGGPVSVDLSEVLLALKELKEIVTPKQEKFLEDSDLPELRVLRDQLNDLRAHIEETKKEIASIRHPGEEDDRLTTAAMELDAIVETTEQATHKILNSTEEIGELLDKLKERSTDVGANNIIDEAMGKTIEIMEACNFQDLSGQRTTKVIRTINYLEERILTMIGIWGEEEFVGINVEKEELEGDDALLHGPQHEDHAINQADIDALFD